MYAIDRFCRQAVRLFAPSSGAFLRSEDDKARLVAEQCLVKNPLFYFWQCDATFIARFKEGLHQLLQLKMGRTLIKKLASLRLKLYVSTCDKYEGSCFSPSLRLLQFRFDFPLYHPVKHPDGSTHLERSLPAADIAHELIHAWHYLSAPDEFWVCAMQTCFIGDSYDNMEEQRTIAGLWNAQDGSKQSEPICENAIRLGLGLHGRVNHRGAYMVLGNQPNILDLIVLRAFGQLRAHIRNDPDVVHRTVSSSDTVFIGKAALPLVAAIRFNAFAAFLDLLGGGAKVDAQDEYGRTALHVAAETGALAFVAKLLQAGASPSIKDNEGRTPLDLALTGLAVQLKVVRLLALAMDLTVWRPSLALYSRLLQCSDPGLLSQMELRGLDLASLCRAACCIEFEGQTMIHRFIQSKNRPMLEFLLRVGIPLPASAPTQNQSYDLEVVVQA